MALNDADTPAWSTVQTDGGSVTLVPLDGLSTRIDQLNSWLSEATTSSAALHSQADDHYAASGAILVPRSHEWPVPAAISGQVARAEALVTQIAENDRAANDLKEQESHGNVIGRIGAWRHERGLANERVSEAAELRSLLIQVARSAPSTNLPDAETESRSAADLETQAAKLDDEIHTTKETVEAMSAEMQRRQESVQSMGFDALYEAASLAISGATPVESPLLLKPGEVAYLSEPATLSRMVTRTHYVGGTSGFSFPIGHTGIRYRVGSYSGHPIQQQALSKLDSGTFVVTNQRIAFIGRTKSSTVALLKVIHVECYTDAVAVFQEGRENPDFYMLTTPKRAVFYLNWALSQKAEVKT